MIEDRIFSVYIHKFPNGKQYVGMTSNEPERRWQNGYGYRRNKVMFEDIKKYGWNNIDHILFNDEGILYTEEEASYIEQCLIDSWDLTSVEKGYNLETGGISSYTLHKNTKKKLSLINGKPIIQYSFDGNKIKEFCSINDAERELKIERRNISACCKNQRKSAGGYIWRYKANNLESVKPQSLQIKPIVQYSLDGTIINQFSSMAEASKKLNISLSGISKCCKGNLKSAYGYIWRFKEDNIERVEPVLPYSKVILQYSTNGILLNEFSSLTLASKTLKINLSAISMCCKDKIKIAGGYIWRFKEDNIERVESQKTKEKAVIQYSFEGKYLTEFSSITEAMIKTNINKSNISACCKGKQKSAGGFIWKYKE